MNDQIPVGPASGNEPPQAQFGPAGRPGDPSPFPAQPAVGQPYPAQPVAGQPYPGQTPPGQPYPAQPVLGQPASGQPFPGQPVPAMAIGAPDYLTGGPGMPGAAVPAGTRRGHRGLWAGLAAATAVVLTAGGVTGYVMLSGQTTTLDRQLPADAAAYVEVSLKVPGNANNLVEGLVEPLLTDPADQKRFSEQIKPWLGKHVGAGADPQGSTSRPVFLAEVTDAGKARKGLDALSKDKDMHPFGYVIVDNVVVVAETRAIAETTARDAKAASLHENDTFRRDIAATGGTGGVLTGWADLAKVDFSSLAKEASKAEGSVAESEGSLGGLGDVTIKGRVAATVQFTATAADLQVHMYGGEQAAPAGVAGPRLATLPGDTVAAMAAAGLDKQIGQIYTGMRKGGVIGGFDASAKEMGLTLPSDLTTLVGSNTVIALGPSTDTPEIGLISTTSNPARARLVANKLLAAAGDSDPAAVVTTATGIVLASSPGYANKLAVAGTLGDSDQFRAALPDLASAQVASYVNVAAASTLFDQTLPDSAAAVKAIGMTSGRKDGVASMRVRVGVG